MPEGPKGLRADELVDRSAEGGGISRRGDVFGRIRGVGGGDGRSGGDYAQFGDDPEDPDAENEQVWSPKTRTLNPQPSTLNPKL